MLADYCTARAYLYFCDYQKDSVENAGRGCGLLVGEAKEAEVGAAMWNDA